MENSYLKCFGVGDGLPSPDRNHAAFLYQLGASTLLIDCGEPISRSYKASGLPYDLVDSILLSHLHFDHVGGFFMLMQSFWLEKRSKDLLVQAPVDGIEPLQKMLTAGCLFEELLPFRLRFAPLEDARATMVGAVRVTPFATRHLAGFRERFRSKHTHSFAAFSFLLESGRLRIGHSADIGAVEDLTPLLEKPLDLLVCELAHIAPEELFRYLRGRDIKRAAFIHLASEYLDRRGEIEALAGNALGDIDFSFPPDGAELLIG